MELIYLTLSAILHAVCVYSKGWVLETDNHTYVPLEICMFVAAQQLSYYWVCDNQQPPQLILSVHTDLTCSQSLLDWPYDELSHDCDGDNVYKDYFQYTIWELSLISETAQCDNIDDLQTYERPNSFARIINKCMYQPLYDAYSMITCTDTLVTTTYYFDEQCNSLLLTLNEPAECTENDTFIEITECTTKMNTIENQFGYVQPYKDSYLTPLNKCIASSSTYSYLYACRDNVPFFYLWSDAICGSLDEQSADIVPISPFAYSCSSTTFDYVTLDSYANDNNCGEIEIDANHTSYVFTANQCFNWFDANNTMKSEVVRCNDTAIWSVVYNLPDCDDQSGSYSVTHVSEPCVETDQSRSVIDCRITGLAEVTTTPTPTTSTTLPAPSSSYIATTLEFSTPTPTVARNKRIIYVTADGVNNNDCYVRGTSSCGTLRYASGAAHYQYKNNNVSEIEIIIQGQNATAIREQIQFFAENNHGVNPCIPQQTNDLYTPFQSITYTFDTHYIHSMSDWYNASLCEDHSGDLDDDFFGSASSASFSQFEFIVNNLHFDSYTFEGRSNQPLHIATADTFVCNNCVFKDIVVNSSHSEVAMIVAANANFTNCIIDNIVYVPSGDADEYDSVHSFVTIDTIFAALPQYYSFSLTIAENTDVSNIRALSAFVHILTYSTSMDFVGSISNSSFTDIAVVDAIIYNEIDTQISLSSSLEIANVNFYNIQQGSILHSVWSQSQVTISNVNITTSQTIEGYLATQQALQRNDLDYYSLFVFDSIDDVVEISNMHVEYHYAHYLLERCTNNWADSTFLTIWIWTQLETLMDRTLGFYHFWYVCEEPIQLIYNNAKMTINGLYASNDITDESLNEFRQYVHAEIETLGLGDIDHDILIELDYHYHNEQDADYGMIYNTEELSVQSLYVYGYGVHETIILNVDGDLEVNEMIAVPETFCTDPTETCVFDADALQLNYWIRFNGKGSRCDNKVMHVSNSYLFGAKTQAIMASAGYAYLENITIQMSAAAIVTGAETYYFELSNSKMLDIGVFYASSYRQLGMQLEPIFTPFIMKPLDLVIKDSIFSYVSPFQFDFFDATKYWEAIVGDTFESETRTVLLLNNVFEINDLNVLYPYPSNDNKSLHYIFGNEDMWDIWKRIYGNITWYDHIERLLNLHFLYNATFFIPDDTDLQMINNRFTIHPNNSYVNQTVMTQQNIPWILFNQNMTNNESNVCLSGNEFSNFAIWVKNGEITSCVKREIVDFVDMAGNTSADSCYSYGTFGTISGSALDINEGKANVFNVFTNEIDTILRADDGAVIALDNNQINVYHNKSDVLNMMNGDYLLLNTEINEIGNGRGNILLNDENCDILCYSRTDTDFISVLHVICADIGENVSFADSVLIDDIYDASHYSLIPYYIDIVAADESGEYAPGQRMKLNYSIFDMFYNEIDIALITDPIILTYSSDSKLLLPDFQIIVAEHGECAQCVDGITFSSITLKSVGQSFSFLPSIEDTQLFANLPLSIKITDCEIGYGSTGTAICDVCHRGFFNLYSSNSTADKSIVNECLYCNERFLDGISCLGASNVIIDFNYWASIYQFSNFSDSIFDANTTAYIVAHKCPSLYCCQLEEGCNIVTDAEYLCAANRDFETPLCGKCKDGYSELFGTNGCGECDHNYWERLSFPLVWGFLVSVFILFTKSTKQSEADQSQALERAPGKCDGCLEKCSQCLPSTTSQQNDAQDATKMKRDEYVACLEHMVTKIILYYFQGISYILTVNGMQLALYGFVDLFNLNILTMTSPANTDGYCLFKDMNMITKITIQLTTTFFIIFFTALPFLFGFCGINICCCFKNRRLHFGKSMIAVMLICVGQILSVLFKLLACRDIGNISVHYFFGSHECFQETWILSLVFLILVFFAFFVLFLWIWCKRRNHDLSEEEEKTSAYYSAINSYRKEVWFWECVLFLRRTVLAFAFIVFDNTELKVCMGIALLIYSFIHVKFSPFRWKLENKLETYLIVATAICIFVDSTYSSPGRQYEQTVFSNVIISLLVLLPLVWYVCFVLLYCPALCRPNPKFSQLQMVDLEDRDDEDFENMMPTKEHRPISVGGGSSLVKVEEDEEGEEDDEEM